MKKLLLLLFLPILCILAQQERLYGIELHTENCEDCGMGFAGTVSVLVCGNSDCCFTPWLTGNFDEGNSDYFQGPSNLGECDQYAISEGNRTKFGTFLGHF